MSYRSRTRDGEHFHFFVIAYVGNTYIRLAAIDHQEIWGEAALEILLNVVRIFQDPENRLGIEHEKRTQLSLDTLPFESRYPFIASCLYLGTSFLPEIDYNDTSSVFPERSNLEFRRHPKSTNAILDITDLDGIRYSFMGYDATRRGPGLSSLLTADQYLETCYTIEFGPDYHKEAYKKWQSSFGVLKPVLTYSVMTAWQTIWTMNDHERGKYIQNWRLAMFGPGTFDALPTPSLRIMAMRQAIGGVLDSQISHAHKLFRFPDQLPDFRTCLKSTILSNPDILQDSGTARYLLSRCLETEEFIDLGIMLAPEHVLEVLKAPQKFGALKVLNLSGNQLLTEDCLAQCLKMFPKLRKLYTLNTRQIPLDSKIPMLRETKVVEFHDSELYNSALAPQFNYLASLQWPPLRLPYPIPPHPLKPFFGVDFIRPLATQMIYVCRGGATQDVFRNNEGGLIVENLFRYHEHEGHDRGPAVRFVVPFKEVNQAPENFMSGLMKFMSLCVNGRQNWIDEYKFSMSVARSFARAQTYQVLPISASLYHGLNPSIKDDSYHHSFQDIIPNEWTFLVVAERNVYSLDPDSRHIPRQLSSATRYAFVSTAAPIPQRPSEADLSNLIIVDAVEFVKLTFRRLYEVSQEFLDDFAAEWFSKTVKDKQCPLEFCGRKEVVSMIRHFYDVRK